MTAVLGLDIGGANLKAATSAGVARSWPFPLWKHPDQLASRLGAIVREFTGHDRIAVTMTGELCDCFASKADGVRHILAAVREAAGAAPVSVWTTRGRFVDLDLARREPLPAAAANWLALTFLAGRLAPAETGLLIDTGSTTTDLVYLEGGEPRPRGRSDLERMRGGELIYTGVRRTPVCAVLGMEVAAESFATMLDAYLLTGHWPEDPGDTDTADGQPATVSGARRRMARLWCADADDVPLEDLRHLARHAAARQVERVHAAVDQVLQGRPDPRSVLVSGSGAILALRVCGHPRLAAAPVTNLAGLLSAELSEAACAYAVAVLAAEVTR